jgi:AsmA protein
MSMKVLKWVLIGAGAAIVLFAAVLAFVAATFDPNQYKAQVAELVKSKWHRTLSIEGDIRLMFFPKIGVRLGKTRLSEYDSDKEFAGLSDMRVSLALLPLLSRHVVVDQIVLEGMRANLVRYKDGKTNFDDLLGGQAKEPAGQPAQAAPGQTPIKLEVASVRVSKAELAWNDATTGAAYTVSDVDLHTGRIAPPRPTRFDLGATIRGKEPPLDVRLQAAGSLAADLDTQIFTLTGLSAKLNGNAATINGLAVELTGNLSADLKRQTANADLAMKLDESRIKAKVAVQDLAVGRSTFDIEIDKFNADRYLPGKKPGAPLDGSASAKPERPIDLSAIKKLDIAGSIRIGALTLSNLRVQNLLGEVRAKNGRLDVDPLTASLYQGSVKGAVSIEANGNRMATRQNLAAVAIGPLLRDLTGRELLDGRGSVSLDLGASGNLVSTMKKTLNGRARVELKDGAIHGIDLAQTVRKAKALLGAGKADTDESAATSEKTDFSEMFASFEVKNGIAHNGDLIAKSPFLRLTGEGDIDIPNSSLNYLTKVTVVASSVGQGGKGAADLAGLSVPVRASGPFTALKYRIELRSMLSDSLRQKVDEQKDAIKGRLQEKLKAKLLGQPAESGGGGQAPGAAPAQPSAPEDKLKEKLKKLF